jgi:hypothetical protein
MAFLQQSLIVIAVTVCISLQAQAGTVKPQKGPDLEENDSVSIETGVVHSDVQMIGTAVINGVVYIDGEKIPSNITTFTSRKSGNSYLIKRGKNGNVSITEK